MTKDPIQRVVVRGTSWVGDAVMTIPALRTLRHLFPKATITLATRRWAEGIFSNVDFVDELLIYERNGIRSVVNQIKEWRRRRFDLAILFQNAFEAALIASLARVPLRIGYASQGRNFLLTHSLTIPDWRDSKHEVFYYLNIITETAKLLGKTIDNEVSSDCTLSVSSEQKEEAKRLLENTGLHGDKPLVAFCPGSINSRAKRWPGERFAKLGDLLAQNIGAQIVLVGSKGELDISQEVAQQMKAEPVILTGATTLTQLVAILNVVDLLITNDTGPAHIAAALGRRTLVVFGPTNPLTTRPFNELAEIVRKPPDCAPCMLRDCPIDHRCMTAITPQEVYERARALIFEGSTLVESQQSISIQS